MFIKDVLKESFALFDILSIPLRVHYIKSNSPQVFVMKLVKMKNIYLSKGSGFKRVI